MQSSVACLLEETRGHLVPYARHGKEAPICFPVVSAPHELVGPYLSPPRPLPPGLSRGFPSPVLLLNINSLNFLDCEQMPFLIGSMEKGHVPAPDIRTVNGCLSTVQVLLSGLSLATSLHRFVPGLPALYSRGSVSELKGHW